MSKYAILHSSSRNRHYVVFPDEESCNAFMEEQGFTAETIPFMTTRQKNAIALCDVPRGVIQ